jgi:hypothetical protein
MAKREIRLSLFYSDLLVFDFMRQKNKLEQFLKSSNDFYGKYKLRLDPFPFPYNYTLYKEAFVLSEQQGISPDMGQDKLAADMLSDTEREQKLRDELDDPNTSADRRAEIIKQLKQVNADVQARVWQGFNHTSEYDFRMALGERLATNKTLKQHETEWRKLPRLAIVFCNFITLPKRSKTNEDVIGLFLPALSRDTITIYKRYKKPIPKFTQPLIIIDARSADWNTLAHEIAHGNGHSHPEVSYGGYYDGPAASIYNYLSQDLPPSEVILEDADLKTLELAYFVRE